MLTNKHELWAAFFSLVAITLIYLFVVITWGKVPAASGLFGHAIGILGFVMMLMTESLYTIRKRSRAARWGRMSFWLQLHIYTGTVGPFMVLLHSSWKFNGLAGVVMLLTAVTVLSGFVGRYIYTAVPRTIDGIEIEAEELVRQAAALESQLQSWNPGPGIQPALAAPGISSGAARIAPASLVSMEGLEGWKNRWQRRSQLKRMDPEMRRQAERLDALVKRRGELVRQVKSLTRARQMLALWHTLHIPIGLALFLSAFNHAAAAVYYATLLR